MVYKSLTHMRKCKHDNIFWKEYHRLIILVYGNTVVGWDMGWDWAGTHPMYPPGTVELGRPVRQHTKNRGFSDSEKQPIFLSRFLKYCIRPIQILFSEINWKLSLFVVGKYQQSTYGDQLFFSSRTRKLSVLSAALVYSIKINQLLNNVSINVAHI